MSSYQFRSKCPLQHLTISITEQEKGSNARFLQYVSGVNLPIFWTISILWDLFTNCITIAIIITMVVLNTSDGSQASEWKNACGIIFLVIFMYNFAMMPMICLFSLAFHNPALGMCVVSIINIVFGNFQWISEFEFQIN